MGRRLAGSLGLFLLMIVMLMEQLLPPQELGQPLPVLRIRTTVLIFQIQVCIFYQLPHAVLLSQPRLFHPLHPPASHTL